MKANNLTISVPTPECPNKCPYCVSNMTNGVVQNLAVFYDNLNKLETVARAAQVTSVLITGKGDPLDNQSVINTIGVKFQNYPLEIQTKGIHLLNDPSMIPVLYRSHYDVIAISIDKPEAFILYKDVFRNIAQKGMLARVTVVVTDRWKDTTFPQILQWCKEYDVSQLTFRIATIPDKVVDTPESIKTQQWIREHAPSPDTELSKAINAACNKENFVRSLPFGAKIYDVEGIGLSVMDSCIQEDSDSENIRSLIYQADGHLYTTWDKKGSILF